MKRILIVSIIFLISTSVLISKEINVVPKPQHIEWIDGELKLSANLNIEADETITNSVIKTQIVDEINRVVSEKNNSTQKQNINITLKIFGKAKNIIDYFKLDDEKLVKKLNDEGYVLKIYDNKVEIASFTERGIFYGVQTLKQLLRSNSKTGQIDNCLIIDFPDMWFRSISDDISRGPIPTMQYLKYQIRRSSELKYNHWMHYVEHVVKTNKHAGFAPSDGSLTIDEIKELSEYAKKYYVTLFGNFQSFGHFRSIGSYPQYEHLIEKETLLSPTLDESYTFLDEVFNELIPAFDAPFFSINCDETFDLGKGASKKLVDSLGIAKVFTNHVLRIKKLVDKHNVKTIIWADEPLKYPEILDDLPKDIILGTWTYDAKEEFNDFIDPIVERGYEFMIVPGVLNSRRVMPNFNTSLKNIRNFNRDGIQANSMGMLNCVWDDGGFALFNRDWYGVAYGGEQSWNHNEDPVSDFNKRFNLGVYGDNTNALTNSIFKLLELADLAPTDNMNEKILWTNSIPERFKKISISLDDWDAIKTISEEAKDILAAKKNLLYDDDFEVYEFTSELYEFISILRINISSASDNYRLAMLNQNNKIISRDYLLESVIKIDDLLVKQNKIIYDYKRLWLIENRTYALDRIVDRMEAQYSQLEGLSDRLLESLKDLDKGLFLKPPTDVGLDIKKISGQYFRGWLMVNPLPYESDGDVDYLLEMGGELNATPKVTNEFFYKNKKYRWKRIYSNYLDQVNIAELFPDQVEHKVMYAFAEVYSKKEMIVNALLGVDEDAEIILNGEKVPEIIEKRKIISDESEFEIKLNEGKNSLLLKIPQTDGEWTFTFRVSDIQFKGNKNRYRF